MGELIGINKSWFRYRGRIEDADLATENGFYEIFGNISNTPFTQSWAPFIVAGNSYKLQIAVYNVSDAFKVYIRLLDSGHGWKQITLT